MVFPLGLGVFLYERVMDRKLLGPLLLLALAAGPNDLTQRRKGAKNTVLFLCVFAPLRGALF